MMMETLGTAIAVWGQLVVILLALIAWAAASAVTAGLFAVYQVIKAKEAIEYQGEVASWLLEQRR